jgi:NAD(P)-dependent dehydrogenase (short-subunit alcohol dehydrogenase family)
MPSLASKVALVTGAASGLGRELALALAGEGVAVAAIDLQPHALAALAAQLPAGRFTSAVADVTDRPRLAAAVADVQRQLGRADLVIACAGIGLETSALAYNAEAVEDIVLVNLVGVSNTIAAVLPGMLERGGGHLVGISSLASFRGLPRMAGYCASKAGLNALLDALRVELKPRGIAVTTVCPGWIRTPMTEKLTVPQPHRLEAPDAARRIVEAIRRRRPFYAFPAPAARRLRLLRWLPAGASDWLLYRVVRSLARK